MGEKAKERKDMVTEDLARLFGVTPDELTRLFDLSEEKLEELDGVEFRAMGSSWM